MPFVRQDFRVRELVCIFVSKQNTSEVSTIFSTNSDVRPGRSYLIRSVDQKSRASTRVPLGPSYCSMTSRRFLVLNWRTKYRLVEGDAAFHSEASQSSQIKNSPAKHQQILARRWHDTLMSTTQAALLRSSNFVQLLTTSWLAKSAVFLATAPTNQALGFLDFISAITYYNKMQTFFLWYTSAASG